MNNEGITNKIRTFARIKEVNNKKRTEKVRHFH